MSEPTPRYRPPMQAPELGRMRESVETLAQLLNSIADPVFVKDEDHRWVWLNDAYCAFMGHSRDALLGRSDVDFFPPDEAAIFWEKDQEVLDRSEGNSNEERFTDALGVRHVIVTHKSLYVTSEGHRLIVGVIRDVTDLRLAQEEAAKRAEELERANQRLQELDQLKSHLLDAVSHELRTPLTSITGFAEFLVDEFAGPLTPTQRVYVWQIQRGADRLQCLVDDLLDMTRLASGIFRLAPQETDLAPLIREGLASLQPQASERHLVLESQLPAVIAPVWVDPRRIAQVLFNLLANAVKFTPAHGRIQVSVRPLADMIRVEVRDTGPGICPTHLPMLFDKFYQANPTLTREHGGTGLGLSIAKALVEAHQGQIGVESTPGKGSCFWFTVPFAEES